MFFCCFSTIHHFTGTFPSSHFNIEIKTRFFSIVLGFSAVFFCHPFYNHFLPHLPSILRWKQVFFHSQKFGVIPTIFWPLQQSTFLSIFPPFIINEPVNVKCNLQYLRNIYKFPKACFHWRQMVGFSSSSPPSRSKLYRSWKSTWLEYILLVISY